MAITAAMSIPPKVPWIECLFVQSGLGVLGLKSGKVAVPSDRPLTVGRPTRCDIRIVCGDEVLANDDYCVVVGSRFGGLFKSRKIMLHHRGSGHALHVVRTDRAGARAAGSLSLDGGEVDGLEVELRHLDCIELLGVNGELAFRFRLHKP